MSDDDINYYVTLSRRLRPLESIAIVLVQFLKVTKNKTYKTMTPEEWAESDKLWLNLNEKVDTMMRLHPEVVKDPMVVNAEYVLRSALQDELDDEKEAKKKGR